MTQTVAKLILTILILILIFAGGQQVYLSSVAATLIALVIGLAALGAVALVLSRLAMPVAALPGLVILAAMAVSAWFNADIWPVTVWRLILGAGAVAMVILVQWVDDFILLEAIGISAVVWLFVYGLSILFGFEWDNANIIAFWPVLFIVVGIAHRGEFPSTGYFWAYLAAMGYHLLRLDSRGAVLGLAVAIMVFYAPKFRPMVTVWGLSSLLIALIFLGPLTASYRLHYWQQAWQAFLDYPGGAGPGGLWARHLITEPGGGFQVHAHNIFVTWVAETGLIGVLGAAITAITCVHIQINLARWKWATLAGLLAWSMVDQPLWWPGPLLMTALLLGEKKA